MNTSSIFAIHKNCDDRFGRFDFLHEEVVKYQQIISKMENSSNVISGFDAYGFAIFGDSVEHPRGLHVNLVKPNELSDRQLQSLEKLVEDWNDATSVSSIKLQNFIKRGLPLGFRAKLWKKFLEVETLTAWTNFNYDEEVKAIRRQLVELGISEFGAGSDTVNFLCDFERNESFCLKFGDISIEALRHIILDLERTYPTHKQFMSFSSDGKEGRAALFRVLAVYARFNPNVEYCQGMSSIAGMLLMHLDEYEAFWCMVSLLERHKYLVGYFDNTMQRLHSHSAVFEKLFRKRLPTLYSHLRICGVDNLMYLTPWFMCVFTSWPCWDTVQTVWDLLLLEGNKTMFRVALTVMELLSDELMEETDMAGLLPKLLHPPQNILKSEVFVPHLFSVQVSDQEINNILSVIEEEERHPRKRAHGSSSSSGEEGQTRKKRTPSPKKRKLGNKNTPISSGLLEKFTSIFQPRSLLGSRKSNALSATNSSLTRSGSRRRSMRRSMRKAATPKKERIDNVKKTQNEKKRTPAENAAEMNNAVELETRSPLKTLNKKDSTVQNIKPSKRMSVGEACTQHPLAALLLNSPQAAVSPSLLKHIKSRNKSASSKLQLPQSPLTRLRNRSSSKTKTPNKKLFQVSLKKSTSTGCIVDQNDNVLEKKKKSDNLMKAPEQETLGSPSQMITRSVKKRLRYFSADSVRMRCGENVTPCSSAADLALPKQEDNTPRRSVRQKFCLRRSSTDSIWSSPMRRRHASDTLLDGTAATRLAKAEELASLHEFVSQQPLRPSQLPSTTTSPNSFLSSSPEVELLTIEEGAVVPRQHPISTRPQLELQPLTNCSKVLITGDSNHMPL